MEGFGKLVWYYWSKIGQKTFHISPVKCTLIKYRKAIFFQIKSVESNHISYQIKKSGSNRIFDQIRKFGLIRISDKIRKFGSNWIFCLIGNFCSNQMFLREEFQRVCSGTSDRFVSEPSQKSVQDHLLISMRRFKNVVRWKEYWRDQKQWTETEVNEVIEEKSIFMDTGLNTGSKPIFGIKQRNMYLITSKVSWLQWENPPRGGF